MDILQQHLIPVAIAVLFVFASGALLLAFKWREVVGTNVVHIVQTRKRTVSYGAKLEAGNVYYAIPSYIPVLGLTRTILPVNNFALDLNNYGAYDKDRVPFELHVTAFFRIADTNMAAARVASFSELQLQLEQIVKGAVRKILASHDVHEIMTSRATFGQQFTSEVAEELKNWGVEPVKNIELMDIKDGRDGQVIANIMAKKSSHIEMESRSEVAKNKQLAQTAEIEANRAAELSKIEAQRTMDLAKLEQSQAVGERQAQQELSVGVAKQKATQQVQVELANTKQKEMEVLSVQTQRQAEIQKSAALVVAAQAQEVAKVQAEQQRQVAVISSDALLQQSKIDKEAATVRAEQQKAVTVTLATADLEKAKLDAQAVESAAHGALEKTTRDAKGIKLTGEARAEAEKAFLLAPVDAQVTLAKEIGQNQSYQSYLITIRKIEAEQAVGVVQAKALETAEIKIIANAGDASSGIKSVGDLLGPKGGQLVGAFLSSLKETAPDKRDDAVASGA